MALGVIGFTQGVGTELIRDVRTFLGQVGREVESTPVCLIFDNFENFSEVVFGNVV